MADPPRVAVVGGGIAGLATAWYLTRDAPGQVTLVEAGNRAGGKIRTDEVGGTPVEGGPDTFLARVPWAVDLCRDLGLGDDLVPPATGQAYVWARGGLRPLPDGLVLGVPTTFAPLLRSGIVSPAGAARAALDVVLPPHPFPEDPSVADVVRSRMGSEVLDQLVDPLIGGINAGSSEALSLRATAPQLADALDRHRSLALGLRQRPVDSATGPVFLGLRGGLERLVDRLRESLKGVELRTSTRVTRISALVDGRHQVECDPGPGVVADAVVVATPAYVAADLLEAAANDLQRIDYASVVVTTLGYRPDAVRHRLDGSGFLVPRSEGWLTTACTWSTSKWPELKATGLTLLRASAGRAGDERALAMDDDTLVERLHAELDGVLGLSERPATV
ncbi:MAG: protoporphyrinogen oxidase, partial [Actinomycetota bacterium]|nr:protoporphyrinogen oxidase [Actinomycetota bacterium]